MPEKLVERARAALARGDVLTAYDDATTAAERDPHDLDARFVATLALARAGARGRARFAAIDLVDRLRGARSVPTSLQEDAEALVARLAKDDALTTIGGERRVLLARAAGLYEAVAERFGGYYSCVNAATLRLLAGDADTARDLAGRARDLARAACDDPAYDGYWREATVAEAELVLGDHDAAHDALVRAVAHCSDDLAAMAVTRRQLRLICDATGVDDAVLGALAPPTVLHYCGHRIDRAQGPGRFPPSVETRIAGEVGAFLASRHLSFGYGSLASGADILIAEALIQRGARLHVVLPFAADEFERVSVAPAGANWLSRFRECLARASSLVLASDSSYLRDDELFGYASRIAMGHAVNQAALLDAPIEQLAVWDEVEAEGIAGTAHDVAVWRRTGHPTHVIPLGGSFAPEQMATARQEGRWVSAILFCDFRGFSRLRDEHFPVFVKNVLGTLGAEFDRCASEVLWRNSWGDAIAAVFADVTSAAQCALGLHDALARIDLDELGLPPELALRIGAHAGPIMAMTDPITGRPTYWGRELVRAARIEPRTPEGEVYVTDAFAALLALDARAQFTTEFVGRITTAKDFETIPMYRLDRRDAPAADDTEALQTGRTVRRHA